MLTRLLRFMRTIDRRTCRCRACQVQLAAVALVDLSTVAMVAHRTGPCTPALEAEGLMRAALVVLLAEHSTPNGDGVPTVCMDGFGPALAVALTAALRAFELPAPIIVASQAHVTVH